MNEDIYRIAFNIYYTSLYSLSHIGIGLIDSSLGYAVNRKSINEAHKGILFYIKTIYLKNIRNYIIVEDLHLEKN